MFSMEWIKLNLTCETYENPLYISVEPIFSDSFLFSDQFTYSNSIQNSKGDHGYYQLVIGDANGVPSVFKVSNFGDWNI